VLSCRRGCGDDGASLVLAPVGVLVVVILAAIAFDLSWVQQAQRELTEVAASAANDAVTYGLDPASLRAGASGRLDPERARRSVSRTVATTRRAPRWWWPATR
jgi:Flp pilus assembly protein TadG